MGVLECLTLERTYEHRPAQEASQHRRSSEDPTHACKMWKILPAIPGGSTSASRSQIVCGIMAEVPFREAEWEYDGKTMHSPNFRRIPKLL